MAAQKAVFQPRSQGFVGLAFLQPQTKLPVLFVYDLIKLFFTIVVRPSQNCNAYNLPIIQYIQGPAQDGSDHFVVFSSNRQGLMI